jgi:hypothetical protein
MDSGDDRYSTVGVGLDWTLIPGPVSALTDTGNPGRGPQHGLSALWQGNPRGRDKWTTQESHNLTRRALHNQDGRHLEKLLRVLVPDKMQAPPLPFPTKIGGVPIGGISSRHRGPVTDEELADLLHAQVVKPNTLV